MSNGFTGYIFAFSAGAAVGSIVAWRMLKSKYEAIAREEIASVKEVFSNRQSALDEKTSKDAKQEDVRRSQIAYNDVLQKEGYTNYADIRNEEKGGSELRNGPYIIAPEEFDTQDNYETSNLTYYADGVIADDRDDPLEDVEHTVGLDVASHFGEYEDDAVYVRNDELKVDYEILRDTRSYVAVTGRDLSDSEDE